jgi:hypothetical protein
MSAGKRQKEIAARHGLPPELEAEQAARALEDAARQIRRGDHEAGLLGVIEAQARAKQDDDLIRRLGGED